MITLKENQLTITGLTIRDADIAGFFLQLRPESPEDEQTVMEDALIQALKIGVVALQRAQTRIDIDAIRREFDRMQSEVDWVFADYLKRDSGKLALTLDDYLGQKGKLADLFNSELPTSAIGRIQRIFDEHFSGDGAKYRALLDYTKDNSPLKEFHKSLQSRFDKLEVELQVLRERQAAEQARHEERERSARKGSDFEERVGEALDHWARSFCDAVTPVGTQATDGRSKKGDLLIQINEKDTGGHKGMIVIEAKREAAKSLGGKGGILEELNLSRANRNAQFAIGVFSDDVCPSEVGRFRSYPNNRLICAINADNDDLLALELAYRVARTEVCWQLQHDSTSVDHAKVRTAVQSVNEKLSQFQGMKQAASLMVSTATNLRNQMDVVESEVRQQLNAVLTALSQD